jgi:hypothetical protein
LLKTPKDKLTVRYGIISAVLIVVIWVFMFIGGVSRIYYSGDYHYHYLPYISSPGGLITIFGVLFLIPSFILDLVFFISDDGNSSGKVGFGLGVPGWIICLIGSIYGLSIGYYHRYISPLIILLCVICLVVFNSLLFARCYSDEILKTLPNVHISNYCPATSNLGPPCPLCNRATKYIRRYDRYYCYHCQRYV